MKNLLALLLLALLAPSLASCAATRPFSIQVSALAAPEALAARDFVLEPARPPESALQWEEYRSFVERTLVAEGWRPAASPERADLVVRVDYGISAPEEIEYEVSTPVYGQTGQTTTYQTTYDPVLGYGTQAVSTPQYGIQYFAETTETGIVYRRHLSLTAFGRESAASGQPLWQVDARSTGSSGDLRQVFAILLAAVGPHLGRRRGREIEVSLEEGSSEVLEITGE